MIMLNKRNINIDRLSHFLDYKNLKSFKIIEIIDNHSAYWLQLLEIISVIHLMFHSWLLYLNSSRSLRDQRRQFSFSVRKTKDYIEHEVIAIVELRINKRKKNSKSNSALLKEWECLQYQIHYQNDEKHN